MRHAGRLRVLTVVVSSAFVVTGIVVSTPGVAAATVIPSLSVSPNAGSVGSVVTVRFGPPGDGCAGPDFESMAGFSGGFASLPFIGDHGSEDFVIPTVLSSPSPHPHAPVSPGHYQFSMTCDTTNNPATAITVTAAFTVTSMLPHVVGVVSTADGKGYWLAQTDGGVFSYGDAHFYGSLPGRNITPDTAIVGIVATGDGKGYWLVGADGGVFGFGDAHFYGSTGNQPQDQPIVAMAATSDSKGYWLARADGIVLHYGDAHTYGSVRRTLNQPVVGMAATADGKGYWLAASDGSIFSFGDAHFSGSMGTRPLNQPVVDISADVTTGGYWEVAADGGVFAFHAPFLGSTANIHLNAPIAAISNTPTGHGYRLVATDGGVFDFGDAHFYGSGA